MLFNNLKKPKIAVIGDLMIDHYLKGDCQRISPEAPVQIIDINNESSNLGGAGNVLSNLIALGSEVFLFGVIGDCEISKELIDLLKKRQINIEFLTPEKNKILSKKTRIIASHQQVIRFDRETTFPINELTKNKIIENFKSIVSDIDILILSDYGKGVLTEDLCKNLIKISNENNVKVLVDPKGNDYSKYSNSYLITPNKSEAMQALGIDIKSENDISLASSTLKNKFNLEYGLITLSDQGIAVFDKDLRIHPTAAREVFDVTGAGDTVIASIAFALAQGYMIDESVRFANLAAGVVVSKIGSSTVTLDEIDDFYSISNRDYTFNKIEPKLDLIKNSGKTIVFTNGCFDIVHYGHTSYLETAKTLGDILIVGINSDDSVRRLKGKNRPINKEADRAAVISSLKSVDYVVIFNEDTPLKLIESIKPDILVKGGDYKDKKVIGSDIVKRVELIEFVPTYSSSNIINKIRNEENYS